MRRGPGLRVSCAGPGRGSGKAASAQQRTTMRRAMEVKNALFSRQPTYARVTRGARGKRRDDKMIRGQNDLGLENHKCYSQ